MAILFFTLCTKNPDTLTSKITTSALATELDLLFENGDFDEKRLLCETVFKRIKVKDGKIADIDYNSPFG
jgi:hypothetical protein